jgi:hypothetical protein
MASVALVSHPGNVLQLRLGSFSATGEQRASGPCEAFGVDALTTIIDWRKDG